MFEIYPKFYELILRGISAKFPVRFVRRKSELAVLVILIAAKYSIGKISNFNNMLAAARFNLAKSIEKTQMGSSCSCNKNDWNLSHKIFN